MSAWPPALPNVEHNPTSIAEGRALIEQMRQEQMRIERLRRTNDASAADDTKHLRLASDIVTLEQRIEIAERMMRP